MHKFKPLNLLYLIIIIIGCTEKKTDEMPVLNETFKDSTTDISNTINTSQADTLVEFTSEIFSTSIPSNFVIQPSLDSEGNDNGNNRYFFMSSDSSVKFYIYAPKQLGTPADVIFPNEKIPSKSWQTGDTLMRTWKLKPTKQYPYFREYREKKTQSFIEVTGVYYKNDSVLNPYREAYKTFQDAIDYQP